MVAPATGALTINTIAGTLTDMAMALYSLTSGTICGPATLTQLVCNDNSALGGNMPRISAGGLTPGATYYVRMWNKTAAFGTFQICAFENTPPANDNPCGAFPLSVGYGCLMTGYTTEYATQTVTVGNPSCNSPANNDVWFTAVVPPNGVLQFDTDDGLMTDAALAVYTAASCSGPFTQVGCSVGGSTNSGAMPYLSVPGLPPGATVYVRVWRQSASEGTFQLCARRTDPPPGSCTYTLNMYDSAGDGWNGSTVQICVGAACNSYTINSSNGTVIFGANLGQLVTVTYTAAGGFQNQISYTLTTPTGALLYGSGTTPGTGLVFFFNVDAACNVPPAPPSDCLGSFEICNSQQFTGNPSGVGGVLDLNSSNDGCLSGEHQGLWFTFTVNTTGTLAFDVIPTSATYTDYDLALWGPYTSGITCPPSGPPVRCTWAAGGGATGLNFTSADLSEGAGGNSWIRWIDAIAGEQYIMYVDNWSQNGISFNFVWNPANTGDVDCVVLPVEFLGFDAFAQKRHVDLEWSTASEHNSSHFLVERSPDGRNFELIGSVEAQGFSQSLSRYAMQDLEPIKGVNYYRLRQVDLDGQFIFSEIATVVYSGDPGSILVYPNPANDLLNVSLDVELEEGQVQWRIVDATGRLADRGAASAGEGVSKLVIPLSRVEAGSYVLELQDVNGGALGMARFMKQ